MSTFRLARLDANAPHFAPTLRKLLAWDAATDERVTRAVHDIIAGVRAHGDVALLDYTHRYDNSAAKSVSELEIPQVRLDYALQSIPAAQRTALESAASRIRDYHVHQKQASWRITDSDGTVLGQHVLPLEKVGIYVPGGKASYPSSVLMNAIPAAVAGVAHIVMAVPAPRGELSDTVLAAAAIAGVHRVFTIGGAQAIAALAYGTETIPAVDKIVGPGNIYVATAKRAVFGQVGLDMVAGPSEILVVCDGETDPDWIAMDMFAQAEHDEQAQSILVSPDAEFLDAVEDSIQRLLPQMPRRDIIAAALRTRGAMIHVRDLQQAIDVSNQIAPEHLELSVAAPDALLPLIRHAGAIFMGRHTAEAVGDYCAGPNHVLPTSGTARFSSPLGVYDFQKRSSIIHCSPQGASQLGKIAATLARAESLEAHARSAEYRVTEEDDE